MILQLLQETVKGKESKKISLDMESEKRKKIVVFYEMK